jgi:hypothetical protein
MGCTSCSGWAAHLRGLHTCVAGCPASGSLLLHLLLSPQVLGQLLARDGVWPEVASVCAQEMLRVHTAFRTSPEVCLGKLTTLVPSCPLALMLP